MVQARPPKVGSKSVPQGVKDVLPADPDIVEYDASSLPIDFAAELMLQEIGGIELMTLARTGSVSGTKVSNKIISNLSSVSFEYSPKILSGSKNSVRSAKYSILLSDFEDDSIDSVAVEEKFVTVTLQDVPYGYVAEISVEVASEEVALDTSLW